MNPILYRYKDTESVIKVMDGYTPGDGWSPLYGSDEVKAATAAALERAAEVRIKLPAAKYGENASTPQQIYQDAFDRGWKAGIAAMRSAIRALKEQS